ncbi:hypothetical protein LZZ90_09950 [Flavobacterium sp. SM15]|uniref:hypothetical protein n=1 Tax=Flavobacterium sp. SM15 TaxID=2908005 RepID=UPI001EDB2439|nr:hypothetical protein [Flavobacterium sp. SM15]MCG2611826.1 hypothetical protein [Flavobacterium sp. SM15]
MLHNYEPSLKRFIIATILCIGITILGVVAITFQLVAIDKLPSNFGVFGDAMGGILNPIIAIGAALLTFLAFYMQIIANEEIKKQFNKTQEDQHIDFIFGNYRTRLNLFINEFNNFNISYHNNKLITNINELDDKNAKKYNFVGLQAIQLFLIEFFRDKKEKEKNGTKNPRLQDSYMGIYLTLTSMIIDYHYIFISINNNSKLKDEYKKDLESLMTYIYYSKLIYIFEILLNESITKPLQDRIQNLKNYYESLNTAENS